MAALATLAVEQLRSFLGGTAGPSHPARVVPALLPAIRLAVSVGVITTATSRRRG